MDVLAPKDPNRKRAAVFLAEEGRSDNIPTRHAISSMASRSSSGIAAAGELSAESGLRGPSGGSPSIAAVQRRWSRLGTVAAPRAS
jgi:hypothetical protein